MAKHLHSEGMFENELHTSIFGGQLGLTVSPSPCNLFVLETQSKQKNARTSRCTTRIILV